MVTYQTEDWGYISADVERMAGLHYAECEAAEGSFVFELDMDTFNTLAEQDMLHCMTARDENIVGYIVNVISPRHLHFNAKSSNQVGWYVAPKYRSKLVGLKLLQLSEFELEKLGVQIMYGSHTIHADASPLFRRAGWQDLERHYVKLLGK